MEPIEQENILYIDTESEPSTKELLSVQWRYRGEHGIIERFDFQTWSFLADIWSKASGVVMYNAPYDLGVLSAGYGDMNSWRWITGEHGAYWRLEIFGHVYRVRRISAFRNLIKPEPKRLAPDGSEYSTKKRRPASTPVIDLLKLWSILINDGRAGSISLKALIKHELGRKPIEYTAEVSATDAYRYQDVDALEELFRMFLDRVQNIGDLGLYRCIDWCNIKTPATFTKKAYEASYPHLGEMQKNNDKADNEYGLSGALEEAYHGGLTIAFYRGTIENTAWYDLKGAYASVISHLNTDRWLSYTWQEIDSTDSDIFSREMPVLCQISSTAVFASLNKSLKVFTVERPHIFWVWNFDIAVLKLLFPDASIEVLQAYRPIPCNNCTESLPSTWNRAKDAEKRAHGKTTLYDYYKFLSNTSYGIKAQRRPFRTIHTNLVIAGLVTARVRLALIEMVDECRSMGMDWIYSDTDSVCVKPESEIPGDALDRINARISPLEAECEGIGYRTRVLSLKRYISVGGMLGDSKAPDKVKLHGKGRYRITEDLIRRGLEEGINDTSPLVISQMAANTPLSMQQIVNVFPPAAEHIHPFAFHKNIPTNRTISEWFYAWFGHLDTKTTYPQEAYKDSEFKREFWHFPTYYMAKTFWGDRIKEEPTEPEDLANGIGDYDEEIEWAFL